MLENHAGIKACRFSVLPDVARRENAARQDAVVARLDRHQKAPADLRGIRDLFKRNSAAQPEFFEPEPRRTVPLLSRVSHNFKSVVDQLPL